MRAKTVINGLIFKVMQKFDLKDVCIFDCETTAIHGITTERAIAGGVPFAGVADEFLADADAAPLVCAHNICFDRSMLKANVLRYCGREYYDAHVEDALHKGKRIDTMMKTVKFVGALYSNGRPGKYPESEELYSKLFPGETFPATNNIII